jgi:hypothetical protein
MLTPKPDITIGLAHNAFEQRHQRRLVDQQVSRLILSDPHAANMGIRFPFLIVEAKGLGLSGSLVSAQNQAAVGGASMLRILKDLSYQAACNTSMDPTCESQTLDSRLMSSSTTTAGLQSNLALCSSIVTEGTAYELWVRFEHEGAFHMEQVRSWRTTREHEAQGLVHSLARIMEWGRGSFIDFIVQHLA